jgi:hypothetical protein
MMELSEDFLKMIQIALMIVGLLVIFLIFISYNIEVIHSEAKRDTYVLGDYLLASKCLALEEDGNVLKGVFSEEKIEKSESNPSCIKYPYGSIKIELLDKSVEPWLIGDSEIEGGTEFIVAIKMKNDEIKTAKMTVML